METLEQHTTLGLTLLDTRYTDDVEIRGFVREVGRAGPNTKTGPRSRGKGSDIDC